MDDDLILRALGRGVSAGVLVALLTEWAWGFSLLMLPLVYGLTMSSLRSWPELTALMSMVATTVLGAAVHDIVTWDGVGTPGRVGLIVAAVLLLIVLLRGIRAWVGRLSDRAAQQAGVDVELAQQWHLNLAPRLRRRYEAGAGLLPELLRAGLWFIPPPLISAVTDVRSLAALATGAAWIRLIIGIRMSHYRARLAQPTALDAIVNRGRSPVLFLRPFALDALPISAIGNTRGGPLGIAAWVDKRTFEEHLCAGLAELGPVVAIGRPGERVPPRGAAREYVSDDNWQAVVLTMAGMARLVVMEVDRTNGMMWELEHVTQAVGLRRLVIVLPPTDGLLGTRPKPWYERWDELRRIESFSFLPEVREETAAVIYDSDGRPVLIPARSSVKATTAAVRRAWLDLPETSDAETDHADVVRSVLLGRVELSAGRFRPAVQLLTEARESAVARFGADHELAADAGAALSAALVALGDWTAARDLQEELLTTTRRVHGADDPSTGLAMGQLALTLTNTGQMSDAEPLARQAFTRAGNDFGADDQRTLVVGCTLAVALAGTGQGPQARALFTDLAERAQRALGPDHRDTLLILSRMAAHLLVDMHQPEEARPLLEKVRTARRRVLGADDIETHIATVKLAQAHTALGHNDDAVTLLEPVYRQARIRFGDRHQLTLSAGHGLATALGGRGGRGDLRRALVLQKKVVAVLDAELGALHPSTLTARLNLGGLLRRAGDKAGSRAVLEETYADYRRSQGAVHPGTLFAASALLGSLSRAEARTIAHEVLPHAVQVFGTDSEVTSRIRNYAG